MYIDLVESLRCPRPHEKSALVGVFAHVDERDVVDGVLGCPVCRAEFAIRDGVVWFVDPDPRGEGVIQAADEAQAIRIAAFLDLTEPSGFAILHGRWAAHAPIINGLSPIHLVLIDPPGELGRASGFTVIRTDGAVPLAGRSAAAAAIDWPDPPEADRERALATTAGLAAAVRPGGRLMAPALAPVPENAHELTRDPFVWVAERGAPMIRLTRNPRSAT